MEKECPTCGKQGTFMYFGEEDNKHVIAAFRHGPRGTPMCFITTDVLMQQPWYAAWKKDLDAVYEERRRRDDEENQRQYVEDYYREVEKKEREREEKDIADMINEGEP